MSFSQFLNGQRQEDGPNTQQIGLDSITLGQLKAMVGSAPKPKQSFYDFHYDDEDTVINEIEEFYAYVEMPQVAENMKAWEGSFEGEWTKAPFSKRKAHVEILLESLEHRDAVIRFTNARRLLYVLQGTFAETTSPEHQLHWIVENGKVVRAANGLGNIIEAMKIAGHRHDLLCSLSDADTAHFNISAEDKADLLEEVNTEISVYLGMLYHLVEVFKGQDDFADELMSLDPPLPVYLFQLVAGLKDKTARGYPIKKLLLVLWKTILSCCGGIRELDRAKKLARELSGLPPLPEEAFPIKSTPIDIEVFRHETAIKYPTFSPPDAPLPVASPSPIPPSKLAQAYNPIPVRHHYNHDDTEHHSLLSHGHSGYHQQQQQPGQQQAFRGVPQPATPAPSPPPSPKPKKQQYQTDQTRPFLFPFSRSQRFGLGRGYSSGSYVPFAIDEAEKLYNKHMYISLALWQMWRTREECMSAESGLEHMPGFTPQNMPGSTFTTTITTDSVNTLDDDDENVERLPDIALLDAKIAEAESSIHSADTNADKRRAKERKEDLMRLRRIEQIYSSLLPNLGNWVLVVLKLLLATVSAATSNQPPPSASGGGFPPGVSPPPEQPPSPPPTLEEIDVIRHREITSKAVSAILLLTLKWFKVSHVMKFHHLGQLLLDTNCLLLILKMFGLQEVSVSVVSKADSPENNFFRYCQQNFARSAGAAIFIPDESQTTARKTIVKRTLLPNGQTHEEEVELITEFSWRNFFATINFAKVMQKLSKHRSHRVWMLVQYKSSAVLKRVLRVSHPTLQLHILKLIKSQVPFCGRKWRQSNMKVITSIYLNCRPDLRDEWLTGTEVDDVSDAQAQEQALRHLVKFYNNRRYGPQANAQQHQAHKRAASMSHLEGLHPGPELSGIIRPVGTPNFVEADVFPPLRAQAPDPSIFLPYTTEDIAFEEEYEEYLSDLGYTDVQSGEGQLFGGTSESAWSRLPQAASEIADGISDSESVVSIGELGDEARLEGGRDDRDIPDENKNNWEVYVFSHDAEHISDPSAAHDPRRSSSGSASLRPVIPFRLDESDGSAVDLEDSQDAEPELGPMPREQPTPFAEGAGVDEVEYAYG
ncbi:hypothetical protein PUNSTDRAFT_119671 [Punctularia strigosozonata HHB-11173 SS5]|uniref:uncharacterized protein n=1 Tax=Punctularia strigosozonata (strain HHB-11173) TaxID=741275 RepID=UPI000441628A|nr:uncharacterized protein PUNSTDRAFT_119671 [Punctularia strigosozonata HHB-11173 SS5]EIN10791.1 hypothetical protein PUNSTDRAFT_119671 [Punctularia strigosozonata HHB-11173 SS5]